MLNYMVTLSYVVGTCQNGYLVKTLFMFTISYLNLKSSKICGTVLRTRVYSSNNVVDCLDIEHLQHLGWGVLEERLHEELHLVDEKCIGVHLKSHCKREERDKQQRVEGSDTRSGRSHSCRPGTRANEKSRS